MANFLEVIASHRSGDIMPELDARLTEVLQAVRETGKEGAITLTLKVRPYSKSKIETVLIRRYFLSTGGPPTLPDQGGCPDAVV